MIQRIGNELFLFGGIYFRWDWRSWVVGVWVEGKYTTVHLLWFSVSFDGK